MDDLEGWTKLLVALNSLKTPVIVVIVLVFGGYVYMRWWQTKSANQRSRSRDKQIGDLIDVVQKQVDYSRTELAAKAYMDRTLNEIRDTLEEVKNSFDGKINKANSIRIIQATFDAVQHRLAAVVERSLYHNGYIGNEDYIADKIRTEMSEVLIDARSKLERFPLVVSTEQFFSLQPEPGVERFKLCDLMWTKTEPLFKGTGELQSRVERAKLISRNTVSDYVVTHLNEVSRDVSVVDEMHRQAFDRNKRLHDTGKVL